ncbi:c-type cytochrome [Shewanella colwelliana]|uniref:c-type cytochrome n=1 Tax=Shewanella colwelliana TaxID=23 RepID=UPI00299E2C87|nr:c-type cytochrome [Shewanella colwelliana]MDX1282282.1 c-type cytochrome [Shewanella colwelliana]
MRVFASLISLCLLAQPAFSEPLPMPASAQLCVGCHGPTGGGIEPVGPRIAGLSAEYIAQQIALFQQGKRQNPIMAPMAMTLQGDKITQVSEYFASQALPEIKLHIRGDTVSFNEPASTLVYQGDWGRLIPACVTCHGPSTLGGGQFPRLAGQQASYIKTQLLAWQTGTRKGDVDGMMASIANKLTAAEIDALASYLAAIK